MKNNNHGQDPDNDHQPVETDPSGRYARFDQLLGKGAIKKVYKAVDQLLGVEVAWNQVKLNHLIKSPHELQRLYSEVHLLSTLHHDSIIRFHTSWIDEHLKTFNFITEMFTSGTLRQYRKIYKKLDIRAIKNWATQISRGLVYLHSHDPPVIHRDLKCDNIFVNGHLGQVKIGDLGLATILRGSRKAHSIIGNPIIERISSEINALKKKCTYISKSLWSPTLLELLTFFNDIGTPEFMAPELYEEEYNELVDVYAFGMCVLEMLTSEFPYSECANPAQIYKKVTAGKLPAAFYRIEDPEAQNFVGKCLQVASKRPAAKELLLEHFLLPEGALLQPARPQLQPFQGDTGMGKLRIVDNSPRTKMIITGNLNPEDDTIFLRVQISEEKGTSRNIYFPFDTVSDTPLGVATEMIKELEIAYWEPNEISDMIEGEVSSLLPHWKKLDQRGPNSSLDYQDIDGNSFLLGSDSSCSSFSDELFNDSSSLSSSYEPVMETASEGHASSPSRFCQERNSKTLQSVVGECMGAKGGTTSAVGKPSNYRNISDSRRLTRNRSLVDVRSQLLHRSLVEEVHRRRLSKTVGTVENIGFQNPYDAASMDKVRKSSNKQLKG